MKHIKDSVSFLEKAVKFIFTVCGFLVIGFVLMITVFLVINGLPAIKEIGFADFFLNTEWASTAVPASYGILPFVASSVYGTVGAVIIGVPLGIMCAVFIAKAAPPKISRVVSSAVDLLAGIPSVVYGLVGMIIIVPLVREVFNIPDGANMLSAIIVLSVMILPSVISVSQTAISTVPKEYEEASLALGATKTETVFKVSLPAAKSGIVTSVILGIGRAIGEAMAVMMVAGNVANMPGLFKSVRFLTTAVASEMAYSSGLQRQALFSIALVLFVFIMVINIIMNVTVKKNKE